MKHIKAHKAEISTIDFAYLSVLFSFLTINTFFSALSLAFAILAIWLIIQKPFEVPNQK